ncbi:MAG: hypothetical protein A3C71_02075 [Candidatus Yanofskybacteria bacterium RIFCSPHIGHO2_02_FULL_43_15c]|uniref:Uncharacterized protein n=2 Tax=Candidatus Yanofskyibacteriota TaxID=1752733 RepID=A0A1F8H580_9BACT|nr:MAG: hypothetical protein A3C71_02075 [Candidatus Yanofskybacteria bacterium RIFCSPHIGHO2_02_FULL_43_15c]OGN32772.1 MAG: hypothetical protein A3I92_01515 [Candidatus Yanofskybacteria bacterium RIFCSPLOWO2_02_FULL_43_10b]
MNLNNPIPLDSPNLISTQMDQSSSKNIGDFVKKVKEMGLKTDMGNKGATETSGPDREPTEVAEDIFKLVTTNTESGYFWRFDKKRPW